MTSQHDDAVERYHARAQHDQAQDHAHPEHGRGHRHAHQDGGGLRHALAGVFRPHTHDAGDRIDSVLAASAAGMRALKISLAGLGATAVIQFLVILASGSVALLHQVRRLADATIHVSPQLSAAIDPPPRHIAPLHPHRLNPDEMRTPCPIKPPTHG